MKSAIKLLFFKKKMK